MTRAAFLREVRELATELGNELYDLVAKESERVRAAALEIATNRLRVDLEKSDAHEETRPDAVDAKRARGAADRAALHQGRRKSGRTRAGDGSAGGGEPGHDDRAGDFSGPGRRPRKQQRCSKCHSPEHNARRCDQEAVDDQDPAVEAPIVANPPPPHRSETASPLSKPPLRIVGRPRKHEAPPGWTVEGDRYEELLAESELVANRKSL